MVGTVSILWIVFRISGSASCNCYAPYPMRKYWNFSYYSYETILLLLYSYWLKTPTPAATPQWLAENPTPGFRLKLLLLLLLLLLVLAIPFLIFINDLPLCLNSTYRLFADDCLLYRKIDCISNANILQNHLFLLEKWADTWMMKFNSSKCVALTVSNKLSPLTNHTSFVMAYLHTSQRPNILASPWTNI